MAREQRLPAPAAPPPVAAPTPSPVPLRLTVARGLLGLELYEPVDLGPVRVQRLSVSLPNLRFPVDLSGGVRLFRHRRGQLERAELVVGFDALSRFVGRRVREALGGLVRPPSVWRVREGVGIGLVGQAGALAFDVLWAPVEGEGRLVVANARGADLDATALGVALSVIDGVLGRLARRSGRIVTFPGVGAAIARAVLPGVGARAASATGVRCSPLVASSADSVQVDLDRTLPPPSLGDDALGAVELARLTREADDALAAGNVEAARAQYVAALEQAPRHPELCRLVAEIDVTAGGRAEAALGLLSEVLPATETGSIGALLLARTGDVDGACSALRGATRDEPYAPLAALLFRRLALLEPDATARLGALDDAVARCPGLAAPRWSRIEARVARGDVQAAIADAEHLEAAAPSSLARHDVLRQAARLLLEAGHVRDAGRLFERALRYVPDDAEATAGLARSLIEVGRTDRAVALLERAIRLGEAASAPQPDALVDLAKILAKKGDLPHAIARLREVQTGGVRSLEARALEADYREKLGDIQGAALAHARVRELVELGRANDVPAAVGWLRAAARFETTVHGDAVAAERHLAAALRLAPRDQRLAADYREAALALASSSKPDAPPAR